MRAVGIIGGLGPQTTAEFYLELNFLVQKLSGIRPPIVIWNVPLPLSIEEDFIKSAKEIDRYVPYLLEAARGLEKAGVDFLVIPCNSVHIFIDKIRAAVSIPVLSVTEQASSFLAKHGVAEVGVLATDALLQNGLYEKQLNALGIKQVLPNGLQQAQIGEMIFRLVNSRQDNRDREELQKIVEDFSNKGVSDVLLACTDFQLLIPKHPNLKIYDSMKILAEATAQELLQTND